jgi:hypothetical protein
MPFRFAGVAFLISGFFKAPQAKAVFSLFPLKNNVL